MQGLIAQMLEGTVTSLKIFFLTLIFSLPLGFVVAKGKMTKIAPIRWITDLYIQIMRGTPLIMPLFRSARRGGTPGRPSGPPLDKWKAPQCVH